LRHDAVRDQRSRLRTSTYQESVLVLHRVLQLVHVCFRGYRERPTTHSLIAHARVATITSLETYKRRQYHVEISPRCGVRIMLPRFIRRFFRNLQSIARSTGGEGLSPFLSVALCPICVPVSSHSAVGVVSRAYRLPSPTYYTNERTR